MALKAKVEADFKEALKARDLVRVDCLRLIKAGIKNKEIEVQKELDDGGILGVLSTLAKQRKESIEQFRQGGREDLVKKETRELGLIEAYMPQPLTEKELEFLTRAAIQEVGAAGPQDMGKVMKTLMPKVTGRADGKKVSEIVIGLLKK